MFKVSVFGSVIVHDSVVDFHTDLIFKEVPMSTKEILPRISNISSETSLEIDFLLLYQDNCPVLKGFLSHERITWTARNGDTKNISVLIDALERNRSKALQAGRSDLASTISLEIAAQKASISVSNTSQEVIDAIFSSAPKAEDIGNIH